MSAELFPEPAGPEGSGLPGDDEEDEGLQQGLYLTWPAGEVSLQGFTEGGRADTMAPGPLLAEILGVASGDKGDGFGELPDDALLGVLSGNQRMESWHAWAKMSALIELTSRPRRKEFAADQVAAVLNMSWMQVAADIAYSQTVARRLPQTFAALRDGKLRPFDVKIIEELTRPLSDEDAATADAELARAALGMTFGELRSYASKLVLKLDPQAAKKRKEQARRDTRVRSYREDSGNAGISGREMPSVEVLASMQHVAARARQLRAAGMPGTWEELKVRALLDLLQERDSRLTLDNLASGKTDPAAGSGTGDGSGAPDGSDASASDSNSEGAGGRDDDRGEDGLFPEDGPADADPGDEEPGDGEPGGGNGPGGPDGPGGPGGPGGSGPGGGGSGPAPRPAGTGPALAALVNITVPYTIWHGDTGPPGEVGGFGILDHRDTREAVAAAAASLDSRWCVTLEDLDGTAAAHGCAPGPRHWPTGPPAPASFGDLLQVLKIRTCDDVIRGPCDHAQEEPRYRPSRKLQHLIRARNATCTAPGCNWRAAVCDLDHTDPHHDGGKTCPCNLAPLCRHHHRCKHSEGWWLEQPEPGVLVWHTPAKRTYTIKPTIYAV
jgi:hypothetical protein